MLAIPPLYVGDCRSETHNPSEFNSSRALDRRQPLGPAKGMSLLEVLVVLFILTTAAAIVVPNLINWRSSMRLRVIVNELIGNLESSKALAAKHNTTITVQFEPVDGQYRITYINPDDQVVALKHETLPPEVRINSSHPDYTLNNHRTTFTSRGGATPGTLVISNLAGNTKKIVISSFGKIRVGS
jgi:prepilin-type N-terminal cleavage/methylation domain-containing protein